MEQVGGGGHVGNLHVAVLVLAVELLGRGVEARILVAELEETLETAGRVLRTLTIVTVGQGHDKAGTLHPLGLTRGDELIKDDLGVVGEVTELRLPHDETIRVGERVTVLKAKSTVLAQRGVGDDKLALVLADVLERGEDVLSLLVMEDGMTLGEGATLNILARNADVLALRDKSTESQSLSSRPVDVLTLDDRLGAVGKDTLQVAVDVEALRDSADDGTNVLQSLTVNTSGVVRKDLSGKLLGRLEVVPGTGGPLLGGRLVVLGLGEALLQHAPHPLLVLLYILLGESTLFQELVNVDLDLGVLLLDTLVHQGLGEGRLVGLVVAVLAVADEIDNDVLLELSTPVGSELADEVDRLDVIGVDVEDRGVDSLGDISAVSGRTGEAGIGGETNLVVDHQVDGTAGRESGKLVEAQALVNDTLAGNSGITVKEDGHGALVLDLIVVIVLDGTNLAKDNGVLSLQMGGVGNQRQLHTLSGRSGTLKVHAQMVLDVTGTLVLTTGSAGEFAEDGLVGLADDVGENVETTTMGHTNDNVLDAIIDAAVNQGLHAGNQGLATLQTESLVVGVLGGQEGLEAGGPDETVEDAALLVDGVLEGLGNLEALAEPVALFSVGNVDELDTVGTAVDLLASSHNLTEGHLLAAIPLEARQDTGAKSVFGIQVLLSELVVVELEFLGSDVAETRLVGVTDAQGIDLGLVVATSLVGAHKELDLEMVGDIGALTDADTGTGGQVDNSLVAARHEGRGRCEGPGDGHVTALHVLEVDLP